jgi:quercetin dioxygenase-like cupin family protein
MTVQESGFWMRPGEEEAHWVLGALYSYKAPAERMRGAYSAIEVRAPKGMAAPLHYQDQESEGFYVAEGTVTVFVEGSEVEAPPGAFVFAPAGVQHAFRFETEGRMLLLLTGASGRHEELFRAIGEPARRHEIPPPPETMPDLEEMQQAAARFGTFIVGPPPA